MNEGKEKMNLHNILSCPYCGKRAVLRHDFVDGNDFGWSIGCGSFSLFNMDKHMGNVACKTGFCSPEKAMEWWNGFCEEAVRNERNG